MAIENYDPTNTGDTAQADQAPDQPQPAGRRPPTDAEEHHDQPLRLDVRNEADAVILTRVDDGSQELALEETQAVADAGPEGLPPQLTQNYSQQWSQYKVGALRPAEVNSLQLQAIEFFQRKEGGGWSREQAIGLIANMTAESGMNIHAVGDGGHAYGLCQWHSDRSDKFTQLYGHDISQGTFLEQLAFTNYELTKGNEQEAGRALRGAETAAEAAAIVSGKYERPAAAEEAASNRATLAQNYEVGLSRDPGAFLSAGSPRGNMNSLRVATGNVVGVGDSLALGTAQAAGYPVDGIVGRHSNEIADAIAAHPERYLHQNVVLSTGVSNGHSKMDFDAVRHQVDALKVAGAAQIVIQGVGDRADFAGINQQLAAIAAEKGVKFGGAMTDLSADHVHPKNYTAVARNTMAQFS